MPRVILLNGPSSCGKTTTAGKILEIAESTFMKFSLDDCYTQFSHKPANNWQEFHRISRTFYMSICPWLEEGFDVVVDTVLEREQCLENVRLIFSSFSLLLVGMYCNLDELERRERERLNRRIGLARSQHTRVHSHCEYDLKLHTCQMQPKDCANQILQFIGSKSSPTQSAFVRN